MSTHTHFAEFNLRSYKQDDNWNNVTHKQQIFIYSTIKFNVASLHVLHLRHNAKKPLKIHPEQTEIKATLRQNKQSNNNV